MKPKDAIRAGVEELDPVLVGEGFRFSETSTGKSSGGEFASGEYRRGDRWLELHYRHSLGLVTYHVGAVSLGHEDYVRAVRAIERVAGENAYPGFSSDPISGFRELRKDLQCFGRIFLKGTADEFRELKRWADDHPRPTGFTALPR